MGRKVLTATSADTLERSFVFTCPDGKNQVPLHLGASSYKNSLGGTANVFCGTPLARFVYFEAFSYLNESRKAQLIELLKTSGDLPVYYPDDAEVYMKAARTTDGGLFVAFFNIGLDNLDNVTLVCDREVRGVSILTPSGEFVGADYTVDGDTVTVNTPAYILQPVILILR